MSDNDHERTMVDHERTMVFAKVALDQMTALRQPASPRNYEIWYAYATGHNPALNEVINTGIAKQGLLSEADMATIYDRHLSPARFNDRIQSVGQKMAKEIAQIVSTIDSTRGSMSSYNDDLFRANRQLDSMQDLSELRKVVENLVQSTKKTLQTNQALEARLQASSKEISDLQQNLETVRTESLTDPLTSLANRKYFDSTLEKALADAHATGEPLSLIMADIDHFKEFNDKYGHLTGDQVLRLVALSVKQNVKGQDFAARYGGEEFAIVLPATALRQALTVGDHIRRAVMMKELVKRSTGENLGRVTVSLGVASRRSGDTASSLIERADACLYAAKRNGRNCVVSETDPEIASGPNAKVA